MKKIFVVSSSLQLGGIEKASSTLANAFFEKGFETAFFCIFNHKSYFKLNEGVIFLQPKNNKNRINLLTAVSRIRKEVKAFQPDIVIAYNKFYGAFSVLALVGCKIPVFVSERASPDYKFPKLVELFIDSVYFFLKPAGVIAQTQYAKEKQQLYYGSKVNIQVIPNMVDTKPLPNVTKEKWVLAVGRFGDKLKGFDRLVEAWAKVPHQDWTLVFAGGNANDPEISSLVFKYKITNVLFLGKVTNMEEIYAKSSIFVIPSRSEGFPNALAEAMCYGLPVISFDFNAGPQDLIEHNANGLIVPDGDIDLLAFNISTLIIDKKKSYILGENASKTWFLLSMDSIFDKWIGFLNSN